MSRSTDSQIAQVPDAEGRVVVTKDQDFRDGHLLARSPRQLLVVAKGEVTNGALLAVFELHLDAIVAALAEADFVELSEAALTLGGRREDAGSWPAGAGSKAVRGADRLTSNASCPLHLQGLQGAKQGRIEPKPPKNWHLCGADNPHFPPAVN